MAEKRKEEKAKQEKPIQYIHVDEFLSQKPDLSEHDKAGFRVYLQAKGLTYHFSLEDFEQELQNFFNRKR